MKQAMSIALRLSPRQRGPQTRHFLAQLVAVVMLLQPLTAVIAADLAARNPLFASLLAFNCSPSRDNPENAGQPASSPCCFAGGICATACGSGVVKLAVFFAPRLLPFLSLTAPQTRSVLHPQISLWPDATGPPSL